MVYELRPHQRAVIPLIKSGSVLWGGVGSGKTMTALAWVYEVVQDFWKNPGREIIVITTARKRNDGDWQDEALRFGINESENSAGGCKLTVDSWNNIQKYADVENAVFIFDEQRLVGSGAWVKTFLKIAKTNQWVLLSATPGDTWMDWLPVFVANGFYKNKTQFVLEHVVYKAHRSFSVVDHFVNVRKLYANREKIRIFIPYESLNARHVKYEHLDWDRAGLKTLLKTQWNPYLDKPIDNHSELVSVIRRFVFESSNRDDKLRELFAEHPRTIIFYNFDYELEMLRGFCKRQGRTFAEYNGHNHEAVPDRDSWAYLVQYQSGAEAWNCITTDTIVFLSQTYSYRQLEQSMGRTDRMNTPYRDLNYYILRTSAPIDLAIYKAVSMKKTFNERSFTP